jgi:hypothetical protein
VIDLTQYQLPVHAYQGLEVIPILIFGSPIHQMGVTHKFSFFAFAMGHFDWPITKKRLKAGRLLKIVLSM